MNRLPAIKDPKARNVIIPNLTEMTPQQKLFADEYLVDLNPKQAAIRAGYAPTAAAGAGTRLMKFRPVRDYIAKLMAARSIRTGLTAERVLQRLGTIVNGDPRAVFNEDGGLKKPSEMSYEDGLMIAGVKTRRIVVADENGVMQPEEITEVKVVDTLSAITLAMRHLGLMNDKLDINVTHNLADRLGAAQARLSRARGQIIDVEQSEDQESEALLALEAQVSADHLDEIDMALSEVEDLF